MNYEFIYKTYLNPFEHHKFIPLAQVYTPRKTVNQMLDMLPHSIWSNPDLKWLEPSAGIGHIAIEIVRRLMDGLSSYEHNESKRLAHILGHMLTMVEIDSKSCRTLRKIFKGGKVVCADILTHLSTNPSYDCIVGNPPFQEHALKGGKNKLYERILSTCLDIAPKHICFLCPDNIFSGNTNTTYNQLIGSMFVKTVHFMSSLWKHVQQPICIFYATSHRSANKTVIVNHKGQTLDVQLKNRPLNPIRNWTKQTEMLIQRFIGHNKNGFIYNRGDSISTYKGNRYSVIYTPNSFLHTNDVNQAVAFGLKKVVIFGVSNHYDYMDDEKGKYGIGPNMFYYTYQNDIMKNKIVQFLKSQDYKTLVDATKTSRFFLKGAFIQHLKFDIMIRQTKRHQLNGKNKTRKRKRS